MAYTQVDFRSRYLTTSGFDNCPEELAEDFHRNEFDGRKGADQVYEKTVCVWNMTQKSGKKMPDHRYVLSYFWTALSGEHFLRQTYIGTTYEIEFEAVTTIYDKESLNKFALHNLEEVAHTTLAFYAVELIKEIVYQPMPN